eukprot:14967648-Alexandrium_andersonii.AAC.1
MPGAAPAASPVEVQGSWSMEGRPAREAASSSGRGLFSSPAPRPVVPLSLGEGKTDEDLSLIHIAEPTRLALI